MSNPSAHNVVAAFSSREAARDALESLSRAGVEADKVSLVGKKVEEAATDPDTSERDLEVTGDVAAKAAAGGAAGTLLGALAGAATFVIPGVGPAIGTGIFAAMAAGGLAGGAVGGMVGGIASMDLSENWELTFQDAMRNGEILVAVHADDGAEAAEATAVLEKASPARIQHLDAEGNPLPA